jgi:hypothetical protein
VAQESAVVPTAASMAEILRSNDASFNLTVGSTARKVNAERAARTYRTDADQGVSTSVVITDITVSATVNGRWRVVSAALSRQTECRG